MTREKLLKRTVDNLAKLPDQPLKEVADFAEFLLSKIDSQILTEGIQKMGSISKSYEFLKDEEDLYTVADLKERYNDER